MRMLIILFTALLIAPALAPYDPLMTQPSDAFQPPSIAHPLGTDQFGRDVLSRTLYGGRTTMTIALIAAGAAVALGGAAGTVMGVSGLGFGIVLRIVNTTNNALTTIPPITTAITISIMIRDNTQALIISAILSQLPHIIKWAQQVSEITTRMPHIEPAKALGARKIQILAQHIMPTLYPQIRGKMILTVQSTILLTTALNILGIGFSPEIPEWGNLLREGKEAYRQAPWIAAAPGLAITIINIILLRYADQTSR